MFEFLKRKKLSSPAGSDGATPLYFKDGDAALNIACKYMECHLAEGVSLPAVVLDSRELFGTAAAVKVQPNGIQLATLRVASPDGGFLVAANTAGATGPKLQPKQLVVWRAISHSPEMANAGAADERFGWVGLIVGTLKPHFVNGAWVGDQQFLP